MPPKSKGTGGVSALQATLDKLQQDQSRHEQLVGSLSQKMAARRSLAVNLVQAHKKMGFHESGYVFMKTLGSGRHGTIKLAKKKSNAHVKHTKAAVQSSISTDVVSDFVAVRIVNRSEVGRKGRETLSAMESHATLVRHSQALRDLDHPSIQREIETFEDPQHIYMVLELYTGGDLLEREQEPISEDRAAWIINQVCSAVLHAHGKGIVHQDIRPDNVHYASTSKDARCVLTDWSCCEYINISPKESRKHLIMGEYSAPELEAAHRTDRSDMWSIGVMTFALLTLALPFGEHSPRPEVGDLVWHESDPKVSDSCKDFLMKLLKVDPTTRMPATEALSHPWLTHAREVYRGDRKQQLDTSAASSLLRFKDSSVLHRTAAALVADHISGEKLYELTQQFYLLDKSGDGYIEKADMIEALRNTLASERARGHLSEQEEGLTEEIEKLVNDKSKVTALVNLMDMDGDGKIAFSEFLAAAGEVCISDCTALAWEAFRAFDRHGTGSVCKQDLKDMLSSPIMDELMNTKAASGKDAKSKRELEEAFKEVGGVPMSIDEIINKADEDGNQRISFEEFLHIVMA